MELVYRAAMDTHSRFFQSRSVLFSSARSLSLYFPLHSFPICIEPREKEWDPVYTRGVPLVLIPDWQRNAFKDRREGSFPERRRIKHFHWGLCSAGRCAETHCIVPTPSRIASSTVFWIVKRKERMQDRVSSRVRFNGSIKRRRELFTLRLSWNCAFIEDPFLKESGEEIKNQRWTYWKLFSLWWWTTAKLDIYIFFYSRQNKSSVPVSWLPFIRGRVKYFPLWKGKLSST